METLSHVVTFMSSRLFLTIFSVTHFFDCLLTSLAPLEISLGSLHTMTRAAAKIVLLMAFLLAVLVIQGSSLGVLASWPQQDNNKSLPHRVMQGSVRPQDCGPRCATRCAAASHKKPCLFFCQKCCAKCLCVPPGTSGNKQVCPCYKNWKTKRGGPKCP